MSSRYVTIKAPDHPCANVKGTALLHRVIWHDANGPIPAGMVVHHKDGDKQNNELANLELVSKSEHMKLHYPVGFGATKGPAKMIDLTCSVCGVVFSRKLFIVTCNSKATPIGKEYEPVCNRMCWGQLVRSRKDQRAMKGAKPCSE